MDVYGAVRGGTNPSGTSKHKFVGSLGHPSDDESGLVYMRARYYDPATGRFASEDSSRHGINWFNYCQDNPVNRVDNSGKIDSSIVKEIFQIFEEAGIFLSENARIWLLQGGEIRMASFLATWIDRILDGSIDCMKLSNLAAREADSDFTGLEADEAIFQGVTAASKVNAVSKLYQLVLQLGMSLDDI